MKHNALRVIAISLFFGFILSAYQPVFNALALAKETKISPSHAECVMEAKSRRILYEKGGDLRLPMASTTKIATALTVLNTCNDIQEKILIPREAEGIEGSSVYLKSGEEYSIEDLLYGLMLRSGNDCAVALALHCAESLEEFALKMNKIAKSSGAIHTNFRNPHGLPCQNHYTTARDLSLIACKALENSTFKQIVSTQYYQPRHWKNKNRMLTDYMGAIGVKTGFTKEAGRCLVTAAKRNDMTLVCSVLNSPMMYERSAELLDDAFSRYSYEKLLSSGDIFEINDERGKYKANARVDFSYPLMEGEKENIEVHIFPSTSPTDREIIGQIEITLAKRLLFCGNLYKL